MIVSFEHEGLMNCFLSGSLKGILPIHAKILRLQLAVIGSASKIEALDIPGYRLHELKGDRKGVWSITVNASWRLTFKFSEGNAEPLNYEDYH